MSNQYLPIVESIATGTPQHIVYQSDAAKFVSALYGAQAQQPQIERIYKNTRIDTRHLAIDLLTDEVVRFCREPNNIKQRMQLYAECAIPLATEVAGKAIAIAAQRAESDRIDVAKIIESIGLIVFVTSTGFLAPGVDTKVIENLGLRRNIARIPVNFMGCAAGVTGLRVACDYLRAYPQSRALVICLELSSINSSFEDNLNEIIIHSIFGDGCAAVVLGACKTEKLATQDRLIIRDNFSYLVEDTADGIVLDVRDNGITCQLSPQLPSYIESGVDPIITNFLKQHHLTKAEIDLWAVHPGGTRIIEKVQRSLELSDDRVADSWEILREYGNMLSCAVIFVIERMLIRIDADAGNRDRVASPVENRQQQSNGSDDPPRSIDPLTGIAFSFSPGVGIEGLLFQKY
ncbi:3-oxoacyl-[acyl-carrier-protein] synthase III C-terminal domain-containing protein [Chamaesiphon sp. VAR_48_metabat_403]|uniref:type III polyketide synthase n=1 Tax=Chamaesiphon sp. VAR_48_metabat_403 TaxID=2964700 RepID=UPI00286DAF86|nr:3-oxoacyl-[acyl-carrier-protein] synthase III C-terminal domain-containing protein [Chamaesiphon sp. VAR_48_metabat_403]